MQEVLPWLCANFERAKGKYKSTLPVDTSSYILHVHSECKLAVLFLISFGTRQNSEVIRGQGGLKMPCINQVAAPMRLSEVLANTTWESLQRAGAHSCVPLGIVSTLMCNYM